MIKFNTLADLEAFVKENFPGGTVSADHRTWEVSIHTNKFLLNGDPTNQLATKEERKNKDLVGRYLKVIEGSQALNIPKGAKLLVTNIKELGADYSHSVSVAFAFANRNIALNVRHINRLSDRTFNMNNGDPFKKIRVSWEVMY